MTQLDRPISPTASTPPGEWQHPEVVEAEKHVIETS
ncbi:MAG: hypothetical protein CM1200mP2_10220 [Planctomycetaceae bacterium]|nr:MAG: hypothetical protein CM1200mP2_10220 [Planctomycetaceae bacterium]